MRTQVAIIGGGPAGSLLAHLLHLTGVQCVLLERRSRDHVLGRIRAGVLEHGSTRTLREAGLGARMDQLADNHDGVYLAFGGRRIHLDFQALVGRQLTVWGQTEIQRDLYDALDADGVALLDEVDDVALHDVTGDRPWVTFTRDGAAERLDCEWIAGCDGSRGVSGDSVPAGLRQTYERSYPFGWLGLLSETPPVSPELIYTNHERGFALCSMRNEMLSRYYVQCELSDTVEDWSDDRFWTELTTRLPADVADDLVTGPSIEKSITPLRSFVAAPMRHGRLVLAGDAAHVVPPTGAKGLNLAITDVAVLAAAFQQAYRDGDTAALDTYPDTALARVWQAVRFSWWLTSLMHRFDDDDAFDRAIQQAELQHLAASERARAVFADNYTGLESIQPPRISG